MSTINLDLSQKVDIPCRENETFFLTIGATDEDGNALAFPNSNYGTDDQHYFMTIYDSQKEPVMIFSSTRNATAERDVDIWMFSHTLSLDVRIEQQKKFMKDMENFDKKKKIK